MTKALKLVVISLLMLMPLSAKAGEVEVLHWWTSGGEAAAAAELKAMMEGKSHTWKDFAVAGGGGENAMTVLKTRVVSGNPPTAAQIKGPSIQEWAAEGVAANLNAVAARERWEDLIPAVVTDVMKYNGNYVAVPVNVHRVNWLWVNPEPFKKTNVEIPTTWGELIRNGKALQKAGYVAVAHGGQPWQDATVFENIVLAFGGAEFYRKALVELDVDALKSTTMRRAFTEFRRYQQLTDKDNPGRDWNVATSMVINGKAAMQIMGDWAKGEFIAAGKVPNKDYVCMPMPGTAYDFVFNIDSFMMFDVDGSDKKAAQEDMAALITGVEFQEVFNLNKGSIPIRSDVDLRKFDDCAIQSMASFQLAASLGTLVPSMAHGMAINSSTQGAIYDLVTKFFNSNQSPQNAVDELVSVVLASQ